MFDILSLIPGKKRLTGSGWHSFNAVCCHNRGHKSDKRSRGGIKFDGQTNWAYHCFNCDYKCSFVLGRRINQKTAQLLKWCGIDQEQIDKWSFESFQQRDMVEAFTMRKKKRLKIKFKEHRLPEDAEVIDENNPEHKLYVDYLHGRGLTISDYPFLITPNAPARNKNRIIIPYTYDDKVVGFTSRYVDGRIPKYINEQQPGYIFGYDMQKTEWQFCLVVEGVFDAISLGGCAVLHDDISQEQADLLMYLNKRIIVVPDQDKTGLNICERALGLGFNVSIPEWEPGIKDVNDAVVRYGRLPALLSILQNATSSRIKIEMARKKLDKRIHS